MTDRRTMEYSSGRPLDHNKACWYPFKKAYERRQIEPEYAGNSNTSYLHTRNGRSRKKVGVSFYESGETASQQPGGTELVLEGHPTPLQLLDLPRGIMEGMDNSSIVSEEEIRDLTQPQQLPDATVALAAINPNCMSKEFWVDEMVEGGSLVCVEDFIPSRNRGAATSLKPADSFDESTAYSDNSKSLRFSSAQSDDGSLLAEAPEDDDGIIHAPSEKVEIEYDFERAERINKNRKAAQRSVASSSASKRGRQLKQNEPPELTDASTIPHDLSTLGSYPDDLETLNISAVSEAGRSRGSRSLSPKRESMTKRVLCVARPFRRRKKGSTKKPKRQINQRALPPAKNEKQVEPEAVQEVAAPEYTSMAANEWLSHSALGANGCSVRTDFISPKNCAFPKKTLRIPPRPPTEDPHFYVEVEATKKQLKEVRDLKEIEAQEIAEAMKLTTEMEFARSSSLVDEDSAFMENGCMPDVMNRLTPNRKKVDRMSEYRKRWPDQPVPISNYSPATPKQQDQMGLRTPSKNRKSPGNASQVKPITPSPSDRDTSRRSSSSGRRSVSRTRSSQRKRASDPHVVPYNSDEVNVTPEREIRDIQTSRPEDQDVISSRELFRKNSSKSASQRNMSQVEPHRVSSRDRSRETSRRTSSPNQYGRDEDSWSYKDSRTEESRRKTSRSKSATRRKSDSYRKHAVNDFDQGNISDEDLTTEIGEGFAVDEGYELARFPSLSTADWNQERHGQKRATDGVRSRSYDAPGLKKHSESRYEDEEKFDALGLGNSFPSSPVAENWNEVHGIYRTPSLDESFDNAVPHVYEDEQEPSFPNEELDLFPSQTNEMMSPYGSPGANAPFSTWADDDSELNTEAFRKLAAENDEDSIFNGLGPLSSPAASKALQRKQFKSPPKEKVQQILTFEEETKASASTGSENSIEQSRHTSRTADYTFTSRTADDTYSKGEISRYSKFSKYSKISRGDITSYTEAGYSLVDEPFTCMDGWLE